MNSISKASTVLFISTFFMSCNKNNENVPGCSLIPDPGNCESYIPKYFYNQNTKRCEEFIWGGCGGTVPFDSMKECKACQ